MRLILQRFAAGADDSLGLFFIDGRFCGFSVEDEPRAAKVPGETRIPAGVYFIALEYSPRFSPVYGHRMMTVCGIPGFTGIRIHKGNTEADTEGCLMPGLVCRFNPGGNSRIEESDAAYERLYAAVSQAIKAGETVSLEVRDERFIVG